MQGVNSLVGSGMPVLDDPGSTDTSGPDRRGSGFGGSIASFLGSGRNVVTDGSEWIVALLVLLSLLFLISLRVGGFTSIIVEG